MTRVGSASAHDHGVRTTTAAGEHRARLAVVLGINVAILVAEIVGGLLSGSLVLIADAGHMATDTAGLGLSLLAIWVAARPSSPTRTFGFQRAEILAASVNAVLLGAVSLFILVEGVQRLFTAPQVATGLMLMFGAAAVVGNAASLLLLRAGQEESLTVRGAFLEVLSDLLGAGAVIVAALVVRFTGLLRADAVASIGIGLMILPRTWKLLREAFDVLLEATPRGVNLADVRVHMGRTPGVIDVHDLHAWTITSGLPVLSAHVVVEESCLRDGSAPKVLDRLQDCLSGHFDVDHCTFQLEPAGHAEHEGAGHA